MKMVDLKIRVFKGGEIETTVTIPGGILEIASKLIPEQARQALGNEGIDFNEIVRLAGNPDARGTLLEVENHPAKERVVIALD